MIIRASQMKVFEEQARQRFALRMRAMLAADPLFARSGMTSGQLDRIVDDGINAAAALQFKDEADVARLLRLLAFHVDLFTSQRTAEYSLRTLLDSDAAPANRLRMLELLRSIVPTAPAFP